MRYGDPPRHSSRRITIRRRGHAVLRVAIVPHHKGAEHFMYVLKGQGTAYANEPPIRVRQIGRHSSAEVASPADV